MHTMRIMVVAEDESSTNAVRRELEAEFGGEVEVIHNPAKDHTAGAAFVDKRPDVLIVWHYHIRDLLAAAAAARPGTALVLCSTIAMSDGCPPHTVVVKKDHTPGAVMRGVRQALASVRR